MRDAEPPGPANRLELMGPGFQEQRNWTALTILEIFRQTLRSSSLFFRHFQS
jgi:hypothetical protein